MKMLDKIKLWQETLQNGGMLVVTDDESRENEGDLIASAEKITMENVALMIRHTSGIICAPITQNKADILHLPQMVRHNNAPFQTNFTVSVDGIGTGTGISAEHRLKTLQILAKPDAKTNELVKPGHIFPLIAKYNGVLARNGHTEAAVDLCLISHLQPVGVLSELMNDDGTVMKGQQIKDFASFNNFPMLSIAELIKIRQENFANLWINQ